MVSGLGERWPRLPCELQAAVGTNEREVEGRGAHLSRTTKDGAASVVIVSTIKNHKVGHL